MKKSSLTTVFSWSRNEEQRIEWGYVTPMAEEAATLIISYVDSMGLSGEQRFKLLPNASSPHTMVDIIADAG